MVSTVTPALYNLRWGDYLPNMLNVFEQLFRKEEYTDVTLWLDAGQMFIKCHKIILAACSTFFEEIFSSMKSKGHANVVLTDMKYSEIKPILEFIYKGEINITQDDLEGILKTANFLRIKGLIPEYNDNYDSKFEPHIDITTCENQENGQSSEPQIPSCSHQYDQKPESADFHQSASHPIWPHHMEQEQLYHKKPDKKYEKPRKKIKEEPPFIEELPKFTNNCEQPRRPKSSNSIIERPLEMIDDSIKIENNDSPKDRDQSISKSQKKTPRQDASFHGSLTKEWRKYKKYSPEELEAALQAMKMGLSPIAASKEFNIPSRTLYDKAKKLGIDTRDIRRNYNKSAAFPTGVGRNINNRIYKRYQDTDFDNMSITSTNDHHFLYGPFERQERQEALETKTEIELITQSRPDLVIKPSTSVDNFENTVQDLSINRKHDETLTKPEPMT